MRLSRGIRLGIALGIFGCLLVSAMMVQVQFSFLDRLYSPDTVPAETVAIVLGASLDDKGFPSEILASRLLTVSQLYFTGKVQKILISGDDGKFHSNEVGVMFSLLEKFGIPAEKLVVDGHGYRTYETCRRAKQIYGVNEAILVTQRFHLTRALFLCERLGIHSYGALADQEGQSIPLKSSFREILASVKAYSDIYFLRPSSPVPATANQRSEQPTPSATSTDDFFREDLTNDTSF